MESFTFNNISNPNVIATKGSDRPLFADRDINLIDVSGRVGAYVQRTTTHIRTITVPVFIKRKPDENMQLIKEEIGQWLMTDTPKPLIFDDEPDRIYYAMVENMDFDDWFRWGEGVITFICPDPYKYGHEHSVNLSIPQSYEKLELIMHDDMTSTTGWSPASKIDNGHVAGGMSTNEHGFYASSYGGAIDMNRWQGPSLTRSIGKSIQDFRADVNIRQMNVGVGTGMIEIYFRDANGNRVAKIGLENLYANVDENQGKVRIGPGSNYHDIYTTPDYVDGWNNYTGIIRVERVGNVWKPYFAMIRQDGTHVWARSTLQYTDIKGNASAPITDVQVAIRKFPAPEGEETDMAVEDIKIYKVNDNQGSETLTNQGSAESYPTFKYIVDESEDSSRVSFRNSSNKTVQGTDKMIVLGYPQSPQQNEVDPLELVMHDTMRSTSSWQTATEIDNGHIGGEMGVNPHGFYARLFGGAIDMKRWQGPSLKRAIGQPLQDFRADILIRQMNVGPGTGMIEIYFRDANGNRIAKIGLENLYSNVDENQGKVRIGSGSNYHDIYTSPDSPDGWNNFDGMLRIEREGNVWKPYFAQIRAGGNHAWVRGKLRYTDNANTATAPITEVQVAIRKFPGEEGLETDMAVKEIKIYKVNQITDHETQVKKTFKTGDEIEVDSSTGLVLVNGEQRTDLIELRTEFFSLVPGVNKVQAPYNTEVTWTDRYL